MNTTYQYRFRIPNLAKMDCHQLISYSIAQSALISPHFVKPQPRPTTKTTIEPETQLTTNLETWRYHQNKDGQRENLRYERISYCPK